MQALQKKAAAARAEHKAAINKQITDIRNQYNQPVAGFRGNTAAELRKAAASLEKAGYGPSGNMIDSIFGGLLAYGSAIRMFWPMEWAPLRNDSGLDRTWPGGREPHFSHGIGQFGATIQTADVVKS